jgi:hypothetical protein
MTKGEIISNAIYKEVAKANLESWLSNLRIDLTDFEDFMKAGIEAIDRRNNKW